MFRLESSLLSEKPTTGKQNSTQCTPREENLIEINECSLSPHFKIFVVYFEELVLEIQVLKSEAQYYTVAWLVDQANARLQSTKDIRELYNSESYDFICLLHTQSKLIAYDSFLSERNTTLNNFPDKLELIPYYPAQSHICQGVASLLRKRTSICDFELYARIGKGGFSHVYVGRAIFLINW